MNRRSARPIRWVASSYEDLKGFPEDVRRAVGYALWFAQRGEAHDDSRALNEGARAPAVEVIEDDRSGMCRTVYAVRFAYSVYVLHVSQKKSLKRMGAVKEDVDIVENRLKLARADYERRRK